jgi:hypothetical protein
MLNIIAHIISHVATPEFIDWACLQPPSLILAEMSQHRLRVDRGSDASGNSLMHLACEVGNLSLVSLLLDSYHAHTFTVPNAMGLYPIHMACQSGHVHVVKHLCGRHASPVTLLTTATATSGWTPLHFASAGKAASSVGCSNAIQLLNFLVNSLPADVLWLRDYQGLYSSSPHRLSINYEPMGCH